MNRWRAFRRAEPGFDATVLGNQVHQTAVAFHGAGKGWIQLEGLDGHSTTTKGILLTVTVADCIPVYLLDPTSTPSPYCMPGGAARPAISWPGESRVWVNPQGQTRLIS